MSDIDPDLSRAILTVLKECAGKPLAVRPLATYANGYTRAAASVADVQRHLDDLETRGYVQRTADRLAPAYLLWSITDSGRAV
jgi:DNA-binding HxlR family transcriptional regulator